MELLHLQDKSLSRTTSDKTESIFPEEQPGDGPLDDENATSLTNSRLPAEAMGFSDAGTVWLASFTFMMLLVAAVCLGVALTRPLAVVDVAVITQPLQDSEAENSTQALTTAPGILTIGVYICADRPNCDGVDADQVGTSCARCWQLLFLLHIPSLFGANALPMDDGHQLANLGAPTSSSTSWQRHFSDSTSLPRSHHHWFRRATGHPDLRRHPVLCCGCTLFDVNNV
eukprot:m.184844 g.184844  ORF g.184844 m.184844 type:complete len:228 (-) comp16677_c1_seq8:1307-1990(-)